MKLKYKLSLLFLAVALLGALGSLVLVSRSVGEAYRSFVFSGDARKAEAYALILGEYFSERGGWEGIQPFLGSIPDRLASQLGPRAQGEGQGAPFSAGIWKTLIADRVVVADAQGVIVADTADELLRTIHPDEHLSHGAPILHGSVRVGTALVGSMVDSTLSGAEAQFLDRLYRALVWSASISAALALLFGLAFASRIARPLGALASAARGVADGSPAPPIPVRGSDELAGLAAAFNDMTRELKRLEEARKQVIADSAHELRTPVTLIRGTVEGMLDGVFPLDRASLESVHEETLRLSRLIDMLRELELMDSGRLSLKLEAVDLRKVLGDSLLLFAAAARGRGIELRQESAPGGPRLALADGLRLGEVVQNLLSNALKYTPEGGRVLVREEEGTGRTVSFSVEDSGPGIAVEERAKIFERFYRIDKSRTSDTGGRGLGLSIATEIAKAHGGDIAIEDSALGGARFVVRLPRFMA